MFHACLKWVKLNVIATTQLSESTYCTFLLSLSSRHFGQLWKNSSHTKKPLLINQTVDSNPFPINVLLKPLFLSPCTFKETFQYYIDYDTAVCYGFRNKLIYNTTSPIQICTAGLRGSTKLPKNLLFIYCSPVPHGVIPSRTFECTNSALLGVFLHSTGFVTLQALSNLVCTGALLQGNTPQWQFQFQSTAPYPVVKVFHTCQHKASIDGHPCFNPFESLCNSFNSSMQADQQYNRLVH